jgi:hypothetical protein
MLRDFILAKPQTAADVEAFLANAFGRFRPAATRPSIALEATKIPEKPEHPPVDLTMSLPYNQVTLRRVVLVHN